MKPARRLPFAAGAILVLAGLAAAPSAWAGPSTVELAADLDDDDTDGHADGARPKVGATRQLGALPAAEARGAYALPAFVRLVADGAALSGSGKAAPSKAAGLVATHVGVGEATVGGRSVRVRASAAWVLDSGGVPLDATSSHLSFARLPPAPLGVHAAGRDADEFRVLVVVPDGAAATAASVSAISPSGGRLDSLDAVRLTPVECPALVRAPAGAACSQSELLRLVTDRIDRDHPAARGRSLIAELGGGVAIALPSGLHLTIVRVGGPRVTPAGPIARLRGRVRATIVRATAGGATPVGATEALAEQVFGDELARTQRVWGACGLGFELEGGKPRVVDPPPPHMVAIGCDLGLPASGGKLQLRADGKDVGADIPAGSTPARAAHLLAVAIERAGLRAVLSANARISSAAHPSVDVLVRKRDGSLARVELPASGALSTDATLTACLGEADLADGLDHFTDVDSATGTVEERALLKAFDDHDPTTLDVLLFPAFRGGRRIGETFITADGGGLRNLVAIDRAGVRAEGATATLAHELGHVLLDQPGHADDFGVDTPTRLMDSDAADPSAHGPRRLTEAECGRMLAQHGPRSPTGTLTAWPFEPIPLEPAKAKTPKLPPRR